MHERAQDAMSYVRAYGRPDLFITFTCNPNWPEIKQELKEHEKPHDRHDLTARVFRLKHKCLMDLIVKHKIFGPVRCYIYTIEWQKRGLPHAHILCWLYNRISSNDIDKYVSAELPHKDQDPVLFDIIKNNMIHGPCGPLNPSSPCMKERKCCKKYPKPLLKDTQTGHDGYPLYRRRSPQDGAYTATLKVRGHELQIDNRWIVPHNPFLSRLFNAHINVEICTSIKSIKYVCKYICKGSDMAVFQIQSDQQPINEIEQYQIGRYISTNEAIWRILAFPIHERYPPVIHLQVHLENGQRVYFNNDTAKERAATPPKTTLTAFFALCQKDDFARTLPYQEVPKYYTWNAQQKQWKRRVQGTPVEGNEDVRCAPALGRVYTVHPSNAECYYLRLLLHTVTEATSFEALRTVDQDTFDTYRDACRQRGLLEDDQQWNATMEDAVLCQSPAQIRNLFALLLHLCELSDPKAIWDQHKEAMAEDYLHQQQQQHPQLQLQVNDAIYNLVLQTIEDKLQSFPGGRSVDYYGLPKVLRDETSLFREVVNETSYNHSEMQEIIQSRSNSLTPDQAAIFSQVTHLTDNNLGCIIFLDAPGGTGKTYLLNLILAQVRISKRIAQGVASSGIAATLLKAGRTAHSTFKLPLNLPAIEHPTCNIRNKTGLAELLKQTTLIVWDECTMSHKGAFEALDTTLRDLRQINKPMEGVTVLLAGDFRQTLPIVRRGTRADEVKASIKSSHLWKHVETMTLKTNMRVHLHADETANQFAEALLQIGNGQVPPDPVDHHIMIPKEIGQSVNTEEELMLAVFPDIATNYTSRNWLSERAILAPRNDAVRHLNNTLLQRLPTEEKLYKSIDTVPDIDQTVHYPVEFLNSLQPSGMPPHDLRLKVGCQIMLLRNLDAPRLCNGTRLIVSRLLRNIIEATIATGEYEGSTVLIPRIPLIPSDCPFQFRRLQFPVTLSFAMTVNKAQGQTLQVVGLSLSTPCFSHGQLYVACSRVGQSSALYYHANGTKTMNIVYPEVLQYQETLY
ncbi:uncharacterized protein LOC135500168 [Lineus longissimus]|uniref:uncharacterized protein LOC135500168 n=1 Tax=Lineus longissimus TaxID=88925 RepID=UPI00315D5603